MRKLIVTVVCTWGISLLKAQSVWLPVGPQQAGGTYSTQFQHVFTALHNQAALAHISTVSAGVYAERRFMLDATSLYVMAVAIPTSSGTFGLSVQHFGFDAFSQQKLGLAYGRTLGSKVSIGIQADYLAASIRQYGRASTVTFEAGCLLHITPQLHAGIHAFNPAARQLYKARAQDIPVVYSAGLGYEVSGSLLFSAEVIRETDRPMITRVMGEYRIIPQLSLQLGIATDPQLSGGGISFSWQSLRIFLSGSYHPQLGITPAAALIWQLKKKETLL